MGFFHVVDYSRLGANLMPFVMSGNRLDPAISPVYRRNDTAQAAIFLRSTSLMFNKLVDGQPFTILAPTRNVDDTLFVFKAGFGQNIAAPAGWVAINSLASSGRAQIFIRLATNTAADNFLVTESTSRIVVGQMACFGNSLGESGLLVQYQGGVSINSTGAGITAFTVGQIPAAAPELNNLVLGCWVRVKSSVVNPAPTTIEQPIFLSNNIGSIAVNQASPIGRIYFGWEWQAEASNSPLILGGNIIYSPVEDFSTRDSQFQRYRY